MITLPRKKYKSKKSLWLETWIIIFSIVTPNFITTQPDFQHYIWTKVQLSEGLSNQPNFIWQALRNPPQLFSLYVQCTVLCDLCNKEFRKKVYLYTYYPRPSFWMISGVKSRKKTDCCCQLRQTNISRFFGNIFTWSDSSFLAVIPFLCFVLNFATAMFQFFPHN